MLQALQIIQLILFLITILSLLLIGLLILSKPVSIVRRHWHLAVFVPIIIANLLAVLENQFILENKISLDGNILLILVIDLALLVGILYLFRGLAVYGLSSERVQALLLEYFDAHGLAWSEAEDEKKSLWGRTSDAIHITLASMGERGGIWIIDRYYEVLVQPGSRQAACLLKRFWQSAQMIEKKYDFKQHAVGILYIVLAFIFAVMSWIFFFEPRLTLLE